jgi:hypothetical protein
LNIKDRMDQRQSRRLRQCQYPPLNRVA